MYFNFLNNITQINFITNKMARERDISALSEEEYAILLRKLLGRFNTGPWTAIGGMRDWHYFGCGMRDMPFFIGGMRDGRFWRDAIFGVFTRRDAGLGIFQRRDTG